MIRGYLQGDLVKEVTYSIQITNRCKDTAIVPVTIPEQIYYTGRDPIVIYFDWSETVGTCEPIAYSVRGFK